MKGVFVLLALCVAAPAAAQTPPTPPPASVALDPAFKGQVHRLLAVLRGGDGYDALFADGFRAKVSRAQFDRVTAQLTAAGGGVIGFESVVPLSATSATVRIGYDKAVAVMRVAIEPAAPHRIVGLLVMGMAAREASLPAVVDSLAALPGQTGFALAGLDAGPPTILLARAADRPFAVGSQFKLLILAALVREVEAGTGAEVRTILATNPGVATADAAAWRYLGYKGGSEPGVIAMTFLLQGQDGAWYALTGSWNDPVAAVDDARFVALMSRAVTLAKSGGKPVGSGVGAVAPKAPAR